MYNDCWTNARTTENWQSYSDSEDDLESMGTITMMNQPQPPSAYIPLELGIQGKREMDEISVFSEISTFSGTGTLTSAKAKRKIAESLEESRLESGNSNSFRKSKKIKMKHPSQMSQAKNSMEEDFEEVVYLKTVPPPNKIIDLTMEMD